MRTTIPHTNFGDFQISAKGIFFILPGNACYDWVYDSKDMPDNASDVIGGVGVKHKNDDDSAWDVYDDELPPEIDTLPNEALKFAKARYIEVMDGDCDPDILAAYDSAIEEANIWMETPRHRVKG